MHFQEEMVNFFPQKEALRSESVKMFIIFYFIYVIDVDATSTNCSV